MAVASPAAGSAKAPPELSRVWMGIGAGSYGLSAEEFADWCAGVDGALTAKRKASSLLHCFAIPAPIPADTRPVNILVDMQEIAGQFGLGDGDGELEVDDNPTICRPKARRMKSISSELGIDHSLLQTQTAAWMMKQLRKGYAASMQTPRTSLCQGGRNAYYAKQKGPVSFLRNIANNWRGAVLLRNLTARG